MSKIADKISCKEVNLSSKTLEKISITPKIKDGKLLFDRKNKSHRYIVDDE